MSNAFRPQGVKANRGPRKNFTQTDYPRDRLVVIDGYDLASGTMLATEKDTGQKLEVTIRKRERPVSAASAATASRTTERKWHGNKIDALMAEALVPGSWVILEATRGNQKVMKGKESILPVEAQWIINVAEPREDKCFTGVITITSYRDHVTNVQAWDEKAISANDADALEAFGDELDRVHAEFQDRKRPVRRGFQFRLVKEVSPATEGQGGKPGRPAQYEVVDMAYPIDWLDSENDDPDDYGNPPTKADFNAFVDGYINHVWGSEDGTTPPKFPQEELDKMRFEVATYRQYKAGDPQYNERMIIPEPQPGRFPSPLHQLAHTATRYSEGDDLVEGKNFAVKGIVMLINDGFDRANKEIISNFMVRQVFANGPRAHVHNMVATSDGGRAKVIPALDRVMEKRDAPAAGAAGAGASELSAPAGDALVAGVDPFGGDDDGAFGADDPFLGTQDQSAAPAGASDTQAPAPAEPAAAEPAKADEAAPRSSRPTRFARSST